MAKYTNAKFPDKINDLVDNNGEINEEALHNNPVIANKADLIGGKVPSTQLPSYVDDVVEGYYVKAQDKFYEDSEHTIEIEGQEGKIYVDLASNLSYRWSGSVYVQINDVDLSDYYTKTAVNNLLDDKVDAVQGKGLSSNDYTDADKQKLSNLENYTPGTGISINNGVISLDIASGDNEGF